MPLKALTLLGPLRLQLTAQMNAMKRAAAERVAIAVTRLVTMLIAGIFLLIALVFSCIALFFYLAAFMSPWAAALWVTGGLLVVALLVFAIGAAVSARHERAARDAVEGRAQAAAATRGTAKAAGGIEADEMQRAMAMGYAKGAELHQQLGEKPYHLVAGSVAVGVLFGMSPRLRRLARQLLLG